MAIIDSEVEGPIVGAPTADGVNARLKVMGVSVLVTPATAIKTPSAKLTIAQLLDTTPFPGRAQNGFADATAIVEGPFDTATGLLTAATLDVEPAENVLVGAFTQGPPNLAINRTPIAMLADRRLPSRFLNVFGFPIKQASVPIDSLASAEGYFAGGQLHAFLFESDLAGELVTPGAAISIQRANGRDDGTEIDIELRGGVALGVLPGTLVGPQNIEIFRLDGTVPTRIGGVQANQVPGNTEYATWRFRLRRPFGPAPFDSMPTRVRAVNQTAVPPVSVEEDLDLRID